VLETLPGHSRVKKLLAKLLDAPPSTLLFEGPRGLGKARFAKAFAEALLLQGANLLTSKSPHHVDLRQLHPEGKTCMHSMEAVKELIKHVLLPPFQSRKKVFIIHEADRMRSCVGNALLKTLEEPPKYAHLILLSSRPEAMLGTVLSRSFPITFFPLSRDALTIHLESQWGISSEKAQQIAWLAHGNLETAETLARGEQMSFLPLVVEMGVAALQENYALVFDRFTELNLLAQKSNFKEVEKIFSSLYYWYRDLHLLRIGGSRSLLFFQKYEKQVEEAVQFPLPELVEVQKRMQQVRSMWEGMNTTFRCCLAHLLLF